MVAHVARAELRMGTLGFGMIAGRRLEGNTWAFTQGDRFQLSPRFGVGC